jgi:hypothetical protein
MKKHEYLAEKSTLAAIVPLILGLYLIPESAPQAIKVFSLIIISLSSLMIMEFVSPFPCIPVMEMPIYGYQSIKDVPLMMLPFYIRSAEILLSEMEANKNNDLRFIENLRYKLFS